VLKIFKPRAKVVLLVYGKGGHAAQMKRFLNSKNNNICDNQYVTLSNDNIDISTIIGSYFCIDARDKYYWYKNLIISLAYIVISLSQMIRIFSKYKVVGMISTGPGLAVIPGIMCRMLGKKVVFFEDWCRFNTPSIAGRIMYFISSVFFVQHKSVRKFYPKSIYMGRL